MKPRAAAIAARIPLVHHPVHARFEEWRAWAAIRSDAARGVPVGASRAEALRGIHVFTYAGPACFVKAGVVGNAAVYFGPSAAGAGVGSATPFDSGSLVEPNPCLQPWARMEESARWALFERHEVALSEWRAALGRWLDRCYDAPDDYLQSGPDAYVAGLPDRLDSNEILAENGASGRAKHDRCADRRAWTWEIRVRGEISFEHACVLHVPFEHLDLAQDLADEIEAASGRPVEVMTLPRGIKASPEEIYRDSGRVLREVIGI